MLQGTQHITPPLVLSHAHGHYDSQEAYTLTTHPHHEAGAGCHSSHCAQIRQQEFHRRHGHNNSQEAIALISLPIHYELIHVVTAHCCATHVPVSRPGCLALHLPGARIIAGQCRFDMVGMACRVRSVTGRQCEKMRN